MPYSPYGSPRLSIFKNGYAHRAAKNSSQPSYYGAALPIELIVSEGSLRLLVDVTAPLGTGIFPDLRLGRMRIAEQNLKRVLNLFSYSGAISLYAASGGATEVSSVNLSAKAHARARRNFQLSGYKDDQYEFITGDVFAVIQPNAGRKTIF